MSDFTFLPERYIYCIPPTELACLREIIRSLNLWNKCDLTDGQFAERTGMCKRYVSMALSCLEKRKITHEKHIWLNDTERRFIYLSEKNEINRTLFMDKGVEEIIFDRLKDSLLGRMELSRVMMADKSFLSQPRVMLPNTINTPTHLTIYGVLYGQYNRGKGCIRISNAQISALSGIGISAVKKTLKSMEGEWLQIDSNNKRDRRIILKLP